MKRFGRSEHVETSPIKPAIPSLGGRACHAIRWRVKRTAICYTLASTAHCCLSGCALSLLLTASSLAGRAGTMPSATEWALDTGIGVASGLPSPPKYHIGEAANILISLLLLAGILTRRRPLGDDFR